MVKIRLFCWLTRTSTKKSISSVENIACVELATTLQFTSDEHNSKKLHRSSVWGHWSLEGITARKSFSFGSPPKTLDFFKKKYWVNCKKKDSLFILKVTMIRQDKVTWSDFLEHTFILSIYILFYWGKIYCGKIYCGLEQDNLGFLPAWCLGSKRAKVQTARLLQSKAQNRPSAAFYWSK